MDDIRRGKECLDVHDPQKRFTTVVSTLGRHYREWPEGTTNAEILTVLEEYSRPGTAVVFTNRSVSERRWEVWMLL